MSKGEKDLYWQVSTIRKSHQMAEQTMKMQEETIRKNDKLLCIYTTNDWKAFDPPTANKVLENKQRFGVDTETKLTEWEKN